MDNTQLVNLALQSFGNRTVITAAQLAANSNNEAKQANLTFTNTRDSLLRMAPWDCGMKTANLTYITSVPGTPENTSPATQLWQPGQPRPPWAYEYQYPVDCLRACWIIPAVATGFEGAVPITTAVTGSAPSTWLGGPIVFKVGVDSFYAIEGATVASGGSGYYGGEIITLDIASSNGVPPGVPAQLRVLTLSGSAPGPVATVAVVQQILGSEPPVGGSYFETTSISGAQASSSGPGTGATFNLTIRDKNDQRVIYTNQQNATLCYVRQVTDPNVWDPQFQDAFVNALGGDICYALTGDKKLAGLCYEKANATIIEARKSDGNEGLTINDVVPDWLRVRGVQWTQGMSGPNASFDWGPLYGGWVL